GERGRAGQQRGQGDQDAPRAVRGGGRRDRPAAEGAGRPRPAAVPARPPAAALRAHAAAHQPADGASGPSAARRASPEHTGGVHRIPAPGNTPTSRIAHRAPAVSPNTLAMPNPSAARPTAVTTLSQ